ncbi:MAG TPA: MarR family transcriptional regulator [Myxococcota bacterium]|jgi:DNA-binding MarR family transcriptional regulator
MPRHETGRLDVVRELGYLALGTRLKRIGERMQARAQSILEQQGLTIPAAQFPFLAALDRLGALTIGELADAVGITQPAASRTVAQLAASDLVCVLTGSDDQRRKSIELTSRGKQLVAEGKRAAWPRIDEHVRGLCRGLDGSLLEQLAALEDRLAELS